MADSITSGLAEFIRSNNPGGHMTSSVTISDSDLDNRINKSINNSLDNYLKKSDLISNVNNALQNKTIIEQDPVFNSSPAKSITLENINIWSNLVNDLNTLKGNPTSEGASLELLDQNKAGIIYINTNEAPYNYSHFGTGSFFDNNSTLINDIFSYLNAKKIVILNTVVGKWTITNYVQNSDVKYISIVNLNTDNYFSVLESASENLTKKDSESDIEFKERFNNYIIDGLSESLLIGQMIYDINQECSYYKFFNGYYVNSNMFVEIIDDLSERLEQLEKG